MSETKLITNSTLDVIAGLDGEGKLLTAEEAREAIRREHRAEIPEDHPVMACPNCGTVAAYKQNIDPRVGYYTVKCPLCGNDIYLGRFAVVLILAQHKRLRDEHERKFTPGTDFPNRLREHLSG